MISLSNQSEELGMKVIELRSVYDIKKENPVNQEMNLVETKRSKETQLETLNQSLQQLSEEKERKQKEIKTVIDEEKLQWEETKKIEKKKAQKAGYQVGYDAGETEALHIYKKQLEEVNQLVESAQADYYRTIEKHQEAIIHLAMTTAEKIIRQKMQEDKELVMSFVKEAIEELKDTSHITIYVHATQYQTMINQKQELEQLIEDRDMLSVYTNNQLQKDDCIIKHPFGEVEVGVDVQLKQIKDALAEKMAEEE